MSQLSDQLETEFGTAILEELTGESLTQNGQPVRFLDQTTRPSERFYLADERGKPYIRNWQEGRSLYAITAYCEYNGVDWNTAVQELSKRYLGESTTSGKPYTAQRTRPAIIKPPTLPASYRMRG